MNAAPGRPWICPNQTMPTARLEFGGDRAILNVRRRLALNPEWIPEPPIVDHRNLRTARSRMAGLLAFGAIVAWVIMSTPAVKLLLRGAVISASFSGNGASASVPPEFCFFARSE